MIELLHGFAIAVACGGQWFISRVTPPFADNGYVEVIGPEGALKASLSLVSAEGWMAKWMPRFMTVWRYNQDSTPF